MGGASSRGALNMGNTVLGRTFPQCRKPQSRPHISLDVERDGQEGLWVTSCWPTEPRPPHPELGAQDLGIPGIRAASPYSRMGTRSSRAGAGQLKAGQLPAPTACVWGTSRPGASCPLSLRNAHWDPHLNSHSAGSV